MTTTTTHRADTETFAAALQLLDDELERAGRTEPVRINAIGGWALMVHGVRSGERAYTVDIDTLTADYDDQVRACIATVADQMELDAHWLNNTAVLDDDVECAETMIQAEWEPHPGPWRHLVVQVASTATLTRSKIVAVEDSWLSGRSQDIEDLMDLLAAQHLTTLAQVRRAHGHVLAENPRALRLVARRLGEHLGTDVVDEGDMGLEEVFERDEAGLLAHAAYDYV